MFMRNPDVSRVTTGSEPDGALINAYASIPGGYIDSFYVDVPGEVTLSEYILAFFNTPIFRMERLVLGLIPSGRSSSQSIVDLASGSGDKMSGWKTEAREDNQLLLAAGDGPVRTWLMVQSAQTDEDSSRLYFGSPRYLFPPPSVVGGSQPRSVMTSGWMGANRKKSKRPSYRIDQSDDVHLI